ncbi:hypothetical protein [Methylopila sp. M107]|uniref:hypothetical protein n=1 Tax=Methylopila sp. M107 TaxID=1101190 RepID=UPI00036CEB49|nr:hypothetical protein [Methylopila sp. M107]
MRSAPISLFVLAPIVAASLGGCVSPGVLAAIVSPTCLTTPRVELEFSHHAEIDLRRLRASSTATGRLKRRCYSNPRTYEEGVAKVLGGVGAAIGNSVTPRKGTED